MAGSEPRPSVLGRLARRKSFWIACLIPPCLLVAARSYFTAELEPISTLPPIPIERSVTAMTVPTLTPWPETALEGLPAVRLLLESLHAAESRLKAAGGYTAVMRRRERINGRLGEVSVMEMKCRVQPFAIYLRFVTPETGKEVVYAKGRYDDEVVAHGVGFSRRLLPRIKVAPTHALAMVGNRHPITEAGLLNLTKKFIHFRDMDLTDPGAVTRLDRFRDENGREWLRSLHWHPEFDSNRPFEYVEVLYDPDTRIPRQTSNYDFRKPAGTGALLLAERYIYDNLDLNAPLTDLDFDPANPNYDF